MNSERPYEIPPIEPGAIQAGAPPSAPAPPPVPRRSFDEQFDGIPRERSAAFLDREVLERTGRPILGGLAFAAGIGILAVLGMQGQWDIAGGAAPPLLVLGAALLRGHFFPMRFRFTQDGVETNQPRRFVPYGEIEEVFVPNDRAGPFPVYLLLADDAIRIGPKVNAPSEELYRFLATQPLGRRSIDGAPARFDQFFLQQQAVAPNEIYLFRGAKKRVAPRVRKYRRAAWWCLLMAGIWIALAAVIPHTPVYPAMASLISVFGCIMLLGGYTPLRHSHARITDWNDTALIITPDALALQQGALSGELRWPELLSLTRGSGLGSKGDIGALTLKVRGASIQIFDVYHWPLEVAAELIANYSGK